MGLLLWQGHSDCGALMRRAVTQLAMRPGLGTGVGRALSGAWPLALTGYIVNFKCMPASAGISKVA